MRPAVMGVAYMVVPVTPGIINGTTTTGITLPCMISGGVHVCTHVSLQIQERCMSSLHMLIVRSIYTMYARMQYTFPRYLYHAKVHTRNNTSDQ